MNADTSLYNGQILVRFNEASHRYTISEDGKTWDHKQGVTTILGKTLSKEALMLWPLDEAMKYLFGQDFEETIGDDGEIVIKPKYNDSKALIKPNQSLTLQELQNALEQARNAHILKRDKGGDTGTLAHAEIEKILAEIMATGQFPTYQFNPDWPRELKNIIEAFHSWFTIGMKPLKVEQVIYSRLWNYAGTFDALFEIDGHNVLIDFKTSNKSRTAPLGVYAENYLQLGAYSLAYQEENGFQIDDLMVVNLGKDGKHNSVTAKSLGLSVLDCQNAWLQTLSLHKFREPLAKQLSKRRES